VNIKANFHHNGAISNMRLSSRWLMFYVGIKDDETQSPLKSATRPFPALDKKPLSAWFIRKRLNGALLDV
jgi:hypothetical protein